MIRLSRLFNFDRATSLEERKAKYHIYPTPNLSCYLSIVGGRIIGFIPFPRVLVLCEMQSVSSRIWTRIVVSNSYDDNHYTTGTSYERLNMFRGSKIELLEIELLDHLTVCIYKMRLQIIYLINMWKQD